MTKSLVWAEAPLMSGDLCEWFALCFEPATSYRDHPIIGPVPVCPRHETFGVEMVKEPLDLNKIVKDDQDLDKAGSKIKTGDSAIDALVDVANDIDSEPFTQ